MKKASLLFFTLALISLVSCKNRTTSTADQNKSKSDQTLTLTNNHREVTIPLSPQRVVVFDIGALDVMDDLGVADRIVAMAKQGIPQYLRKYESDKDIVNAGGLMDPNFEKIHAARPDLIIIGLRQLKDYDEYAKIAPTYLYDLDYKNFVGSIRENVKAFGQIFEIEDQAEKRLAKMEAVIEKEKIEEGNAKALLVLYNNGKFSAYGKGSRFGFMFDDFGVLPEVDDIKTSTHGASISSEYLYDHNPEVLFVIDRNAAIGEGAIQKESIENALVKKTKAYKNNRLIYLSPETWYIAGGGIQAIEKAAREVGAAY